MATLPSSDYPASCLYIVTPAINKQCGGKGVWAVWYRVGTGRILVKKPLLRCKDHVGETVEMFAKDDYEIGYLDQVIRWYLKRAEEKQQEV